MLPAPGDGQMGPPNGGWSLRCWGQIRGAAGHPAREISGGGSPARTSREALPSSLARCSSFWRCSGGCLGASSRHSWARTAARSAHALRRRCSAAETGAGVLIEIGAKDVAGTGAEDVARTGAEDVARTGAEDVAGTGAEDVAGIGAALFAGIGAALFAGIGAEPVTGTGAAPVTEIDAGLAPTSGVDWRATTGAGRAAPGGACVSANTDAAGIACRTPRASAAQGRICAAVAAAAWDATCTVARDIGPDGGWFGALGRCVAGGCDDRPAAGCGRAAWWSAVCLLADWGAVCVPALAPTPAPTAQPVPVPTPAPAPPPA